MGYTVEFNSKTPELENKTDIMNILLTKLQITLKTSNTSLGGK